MSPEPDIRLWCPDLPREELRNRLKVARGVVNAKDAAPANTRYLSDAFIPALPWHDATECEVHELLHSQDAPQFHRTIGLVRFEQDLANRAREIFFGRSSGVISPEEAARLRKLLREDIVGALKLNSYWQMADAVAEPCIDGNSIGKPTVSFEPDSGVLVGLHIDSFDRLQGEKRRQATNRLCINAGEEDRFFLFMTSQAATIFSEVEARDNEFPAAPRLATRYLMARGRQIVWRLRLRPCEAYIAPTENMIHDASSQEKSRLDIHCTLRGRFLPRGVA